MAENLHWKYRMEKNSLILYSGENKIGRIGVERDKTGQITKGTVAWYNPALTNHIDFFDKLETVPGLEGDDMLKLKEIRGNFFIAEGYDAKRKGTQVTMAYSDTPEEKQTMLDNIKAIKKGMKGERFEDIVKEMVSEVILGPELHQMLKTVGTYAIIRAIEEDLPEDADLDELSLDDFGPFTKIIEKRVKEMDFVSDLYKQGLRKEARKYVELINYFLGKEETNI